jgi:hypothetical protein
VPGTLFFDVNVKRLIRKLADLITDLSNKNNDGLIPFYDEQKHDESGMKKLLQLIANIFDNENDNDTNGIEQDTNDYGDYGDE